MKRFLKWLGKRLGPSQSTPDTNQRQPRPRIDPARAGKPTVAKKPPPMKKAETQEYSAGSIGDIADGGPGKNILMHSRHVREETGTHDTLKMVDDSILESDESGESDGIDPYNTGRFDRSKFWDKTSLK